jgi:hypothetical protein
LYENFVLKSNDGKLLLLKNYSFFSTSIQNSHNTLNPIDFHIGKTISVPFWLDQTGDLLTNLLRKIILTHSRTKNKTWGKLYVVTLKQLN